MLLHEFAQASFIPFGGEVPVDVPGSRWSTSRHEVSFARFQAVNDCIVLCTQALKITFEKCLEKYNKLK